MLTRPIFNLSTSTQWDKFGPELRHFIWEFSIEERKTNLWYVMNYYEQKYNIQTNLRSGGILNIMT